jgi:serine/threonine-protein kinase
MTPTPPAPEFVTLQRAVAGRYSLDRELGRGGMGVVFLARDVALDRLVAIKLLPPALATLPHLRARFLQEARTAARLSHPNIVPIHAVEEHGELVCFVMSYVNGETLGARVRRAGPLAPEAALKVIQQVAWALGHAHAHGVVHRDVKPDNVLLETGTGRALVTDFGIAAVAADRRTGGPADESGARIGGTPQYMSPEQARGESADARSDLYSLGVTAFFALSGRLPFEGTTVAGLLAQHAGTPAPAVQSVAPRVPSRLAAALDRCLRKAPADRFADAEALATALEAARDLRTDVPAPVRDFLRDAEGASGEIGTSLAVGAAALGIYWAFFTGDLFAGFVFYPAGALGFGLGGARFGQVIAKARELARQGYDHPTVRPAVALEERRRLAEQPVDAAARRGMTRDTWMIAGLGAAKTALALWVASLDGPIALNFLGAAAAIMVPVATVRKLWNDLRGGRTPVWTRLLQGKLGRFVFWVGALGVKPPARPVPAAGEPTVLALGRAADALFHALPPGQQARLAELPGLIARLEADALALKARAGPDATDGRHATAVAALETLRLDLLRLHAGTGTLDDLTQNLEAVKRLGEEIDAELAGRREVREVLREPAPATSEASRSSREST